MKCLDGSSETEKNGSDHENISVSFVQQEIIDKQFREKFSIDASARFFSELSKADDRSHRTTSGNVLHIMKKKHVSKNVKGIVAVVAAGVSGPLGALLSTGKLTYFLGSMAFNSYQRSKDIFKVLELAREQTEDEAGDLYINIKGIFEEVSHELKRIFWYLLVRIDVTKPRDLHRLVKLCIKLIFETAVWKSEEFMTCEAIIRKIVFTKVSITEKMAGIENSPDIVIGNNVLNISNVFRKQGVCVDDGHGNTDFLNKKDEGMKKCYGYRNEIYSYNKDSGLYQVAEDLELLDAEKPVQNGWLACNSILFSFSEAQLNYQEESRFWYPGVSSKSRFDQLVKEENKSNSIGEQLILKNLTIVGEELNMENLGDINFQYCTFLKCHTKENEDKDQIVKNSNFTGCTFSFCDLQNVSFDSCDFNMCSLLFCNVEKVVMKCHNMDWINIEGTNFSEITIVSKNKEEMVLIKNDIFQGFPGDIGPLPFLEFVDPEDSDTGKFQIKMNQAVEEYLHRLYLPVEVVSIVGATRGGKSYLMNMLMDDTSGFPLGHTEESETKGIWIWIKRHPIRPERALVLLDSEGLYASGDQDQDIWMFTLNVLISSVFIYNIRGVLDYKALEDLGVALSISDYIKAKEDDDDDSELDLYFPEILFVLRDFILKLSHSSEDSYLEHQLTEKDGKSRKNTANNKVRRTIKNYFTKRKCFLFPMPVNDTEDMERLDEIPQEKLSVKFLAESQKLKSCIMDKDHLKSFGRRDVNGRSLLTFTNYYVKAINERSLHNTEIPAIESMIDYVAEVEFKHAFSSSMEHFRTKCVQDIQPLLPMSSDQLEERLHSLKMQAEKMFMLKNKLSAERLDEFYEGIDFQYQWITDLNDEASEKECEQALETAHSQLIVDAEHHYIKAGGFLGFQTATEKCRDEYYSSPSVKNLDIWVSQMHYREYKRKHIQPLMKLILWADKGIDKEMKNKEEERFAKNEEIQKKHHLEENLAQIRKQQIKDSKKYCQQMKNILKNNLTIKKKESEKIERQLKNLIDCQNDASHRREKATVEKLSARIKNLEIERCTVAQQKLMLKQQLQETRLQGVIRGQKLAAMTFKNELSADVSYTLVIAEGVKSIERLSRIFDKRKADIEKDLNIRFSQRTQTYKVKADTKETALVGLPFNTNSKTYIQLYFTFEDKKYKFSSNHVNCPMANSDTGLNLNIVLCLKNGIPEVHYFLPSFIYTRKIKCTQCETFPFEI